MYMGFCGTAALITNYGAGVHQWNVSVKDATELAYVCLLEMVLRRLGYRKQRLQFVASTDRKYRRDSIRAYYIPGQTFDSSSVSPHLCANTKWKLDHIPLHSPCHLGQPNTIFH